MKLKHNLLLSLFMLTSGLSFSQTLEELLMNDVYFDSTQLVNQKVHSLHAYIEQIDRSKNDPPVFHTFKFMEIEWNNLGQVTYKRHLSKSSKGTNLGSSKTRYNKYKYDDFNRLIKESNTTGRGLDSNCYSIGYNKDGRIISRTNSYGNFQVNSFKYTWKNGEVVDIKMMEKNEYDKIKSPSIKFDKTGRILEYVYSDHSYQFQKKTIENKTTTHWKHVRNDSVLMQNTNVIIADKNLLISNLRLNAIGDTNKMIKADYDDYGNITSLHIKEWKTVYNEGEDYNLGLHNEKTSVDESKYEFENFYINGLLNKRIITEHLNFFSPEGRKVTQRFHLETNELTDKYWPPVIVEKEYDGENIDVEIPEMEVVSDEEIPEAPEKIDE